MQLVRLLQLVSEYLLYVQETLHRRNVTLEGALETAQGQLRDQAEYIGVLEAQLRARGGAAAGAAEPIAQCNVCHKAFESNAYLQAHIRRRHPGHTQHPRVDANAALPAAALPALPEGGGALACAAVPPTAPPAALKRRARLLACG